MKRGHVLRRHLDHTLTDRGRKALEEWARTPTPLPKIQNEAILRVLASDLVPPDATLQGLAPLREEIEEQLAYLDRARRTWPETAPHRAHLLEVNEIFGEGVLRLQLEWLKEAEKTLRAQG